MNYRENIDLIFEKFIMDEKATEYYNDILKEFTEQYDIYIKQGKSEETANKLLDEKLVKIKITLSWNLQYKRLKRPSSLKRDSSKNKILLILMILFGLLSLVTLLDGYQIYISMIFTPVIFLVLMAGYYIDNMVIRALGYQLIMILYLCLSILLFSLYYSSYMEKTGMVILLVCLYSLFILGLSFTKYILLKKYQLVGYGINIFYFSLDIVTCIIIYLCSYHILSTFF